MRNISSPYYNFKGSCSELDKALPEFLCLPIDPVTFDDLFSIKHQKIKVQDINAWFEKNPFFDEKVEANEKDKETVGIFMKDDLKRSETLYRFNEYDLITPFSKDDKWINSTKARELIALPPIHWEEIGELELIYSLLMHLYWNKISEFQPLMRFFPQKIDSPIFTLTPYELELLNGDAAYQKTLAVRRGFRESFQNFSRILHKHLSDEQRESLLRNFEPIEEDFMYAMMLVSKYSWLEQQYEALQKKPHFYIPLALFLFGSKIEEDGISIRRGVDEKNGTKKIDRFLIATKNLDKGEELFLKTGVRETEIQIDEDDNYMLLKGYIPEDNNRDCIDLYLMEETLATSWGIPTIACFNLVNKRIIVFQAVGNLMNMNDDQYQACKKMVVRKETRVMGYEDEKLKVFQMCFHPQWTKFDIWERPLMELEKKTLMYENKLKKVKKYVKAREKYHLNSKNGKLIRRLFEKRLALCRDLRIEIYKIMESPKAYLMKQDL